MSAVHLSRAVIPYMQKQNWGRIIHLCSYSVKNPIPNLVLSNSIRSAVVALGKTQADELGAHGILVNSILTGWTDTERVGEIMQARAAQQNIKMEDAEVQYVPENTVKVEGKDAENLLKLMEALEEHDDVQHVYANFDIDDKELAAFHVG